VTRRELNDWIGARRAERLWVQPCAAYCGAWFAQARKGRRGMLCGKHRCLLWMHYRHHTGRAPPDYEIAKWKVKWGDMPRQRDQKRALVATAETTP
jgi:hypothetical protein